MKKEILQSAIWTGLEKLNNLIDRFEDRYGYLRVPGNWHKSPKISSFLCRIGRHDYELFAINVNTTKRASATLLCFYCGQQKNSLITPFDEN